MNDATPYQCEVETQYHPDGLLTIQQWTKGYKVFLLDPNKRGYRETQEIVAEVESLTDARKVVAEHQEKV